MIISAGPQHITIAVSEDFGHTIEHAQLRTDQSFLMQKLKETLEKVAVEQQTFSRENADRALGLSEPKIARDELEKDEKAQLNERQVLAIQKGLGSEALYVWGPPGTGKTQSLAELVFQLYSRGDRVLVVSNTNLAVDALLYKVCERVAGAGDEGFERGSVLRTGLIQDPKLLDKFQEFVDPDRVAARLSQNLVREKETCRGKLEPLLPRIEACKGVLAAFEELESIDPELSEAQSALERAGRELDRNRREFDTTASQWKGLRARLESAEHNSALRNLITANTPAQLRRRMADLEERETALCAERHRLEESRPRLEYDLAQLSRRRDQARSRIAGKDRQEERRRLERLEAEAAPLLSRIQEIDRQLSEIEETVLRNCRVLAGTATQSYLRPTRFSGYDAVVIDEASMLPLPLVYWAAGLAQHRVVIAGDFRQLGPIVQTRSAVVQEWVGSDVFDHTGIRDAVDSGQTIEKLVDLREQYRMQEEICTVVNGPFYKGKLQTRANPSDCPSPPYPFEGRLTLVDTSSEWPFANLRPGTYSRYNVMHALGIRGLCEQLRSSGFVQGRESVGVVSPYAAQADLVKCLLQESDLSDIESGTVHRFQGNEKHMIIVDITDAPGPLRLGHFAQANRIHEAGARLFNVAFSRARDHLVVFADLTYLEDRLPGDSFLRTMLYGIQQNGRVIDAKEFLAVSADDLARFTANKALVEVSLDSGKQLSVDGTSFMPLAESDVKAAQASVVIFSGFCTEARVAAWAPLLAEKVKSGVPVRCVTRPPDRQGNMDRVAVSRGLDTLEGLGCVVDLRAQVHEKLVVIDGRIAWVGSLNPLSATKRTDELMFRHESAELCHKLAALLAARSLPRAEAATALDRFAERENPACPDCRSRTVFSRGKYGPFFYCAEKCGWKAGLDRLRQAAAVGSADGEPEPEPELEQCPECGSRLVLRRGRFGRFFGCSRFPDCKGTARVAAKRPQKS